MKKFLIILIFLLSSHIASASILSVDVDKNQVKTGSIINATLFLNTEGQSVNTVEGDLKYDDNFLQVEAVNIGGSFVSFWIEKPNSQTLGIIHFAGIVPGGVTVAKGEVFKVIFRAKKAGDVNLLIDNVHLYLNDGQGSEATTKTSNANIKISQSAGGADEQRLSTDTVPPEKFTLVRTRDSSVYDDNWFVVYSTVDKGSGVDHYRVCELWKCVTAESPFLLKNQTPFYHITVNAYDMNGNSTSSAITSPWLIILLVFLFFVGIIYLCFPKNLTARKNLARK